MTVWDHLYSFGYGIGARWIAIGHQLRGHDVHWRQDIDLWLGMTGSIVCENCPDTKDHCGLFIWSRDWVWMRWVAQKLCAWLGHPELRHPRYWIGTGDPLDDGNMVEIEDKLYCYRCFADVPRP